jgi:hypothetical protein
MAAKVGHYEQEHIEDVELKVPAANARARLVPRPSEDPADPLNWPMKLKLLILFEVCWLAFVSFASLIFYFPQRTDIYRLVVGNLEHICDQSGVQSAR